MAKETYLYGKRDLRICICSDVLLQLSGCRVLPNSWCLKVPDALCLMCVCVCVCVYRERESVCVCVCVSERVRLRESARARARERESARARESARVRERDRETERQRDRNTSTPFVGLRRAADRVVTVEAELACLRLFSQRCGQVHLCACRASVRERTRV